MPNSAIWSIYPPKCGIIKVENYIKKVNSMYEARISAMLMVQSGVIIGAAGNQMTFQRQDSKDMLM